ncbi:MAG: DUF2934 domain-containing protein [Candidatus Methylomirabilota bacterium]
MVKQGSPRTTKAANESAARTRGNSRAPSSTPAKAPLAVTLSHDELAARAYTLFLARGGRHGDDWRDWFQAEAELRRERETGRTPPHTSESPLAHGAPRTGSRGR